MGLSLAFPVPFRGASSLQCCPLFSSFFLLQPVYPSYVPVPVPWPGLGCLSPTLGKHPVLPYSQNQKCRGRQNSSPSSNREENQHMVTQSRAHRGAPLKRGFWGFFQTNHHKTLEKAANQTQLMWGKGQRSDAPATNQCPK